MRTNILFLFFAFSVLIISNCSKSADNELIYADGSDGNWLLHGLNYSENRYSPLAQINEENIDQLGLDWQLDLGMKRGIEATPIIKDGVMYFSGSSGSSANSRSTSPIGRRNGFFSTLARFRG